MNLKKIISVNIYLAFLLISCGEEYDQQKKILENLNSSSVEKVLEFSTHEDGQLFSSSLTSISTDGSENIYFADTQSQKVYSFTNEKNYRWSFGGEGAGSGEFEWISDIYIDQGEIYVYDSALGRVSIFDTETGRLIKEHTTELGGVMLFNQIRLAASGKLLIPYRDNDSHKLIQVYDLGNSQSSYDILQTENIYKTDETHVENYIIERDPGYPLQVGEKIVYTSKLYDGKLLVLGKTDKKEWEIKGTIAGYEAIEETVIIHESSEDEHAPSHLSGFNPEGGYFHAEFLSVSYGLFEQEDGSVAHLSSHRTEEQQWNIVVEIFDIQGSNLKETYVLEDLVLEDYQDMMFPWMDNQGHIFVSEDSETPIRKLKISEL